MAEGEFHKRSVYYEPAEKPKSELYRDLLPLINSVRSIFLRTNASLYSSPS